MVNLGPEFGLLSFYRDYQMSRFWAAYSVRSETVSGTQRLRFVSKSDSRLTTLQDACPPFDDAEARRNLEEGVVCRCSPVCCTPELTVRLHDGQ